MSDKKKKYPQEYEGAINWDDENGDLKFSIIRTKDFEHELYPREGHYCGYAIFPKRPVKEKKYGGILIYTPVHGRVTYACEEKDGSMVYGFYCGHADDENNSNLRDIDWLKKECIRMGYAIKLAVKYEKKYLKAKKQTTKAKHLDAYDAMCNELFDTEPNAFNLGKALNLLSGKLYTCQSK